MQTKVLIAFDPLVSQMLVGNGNDLDQVTNACQSEANNASGVEGSTKRGDFRGGQSYKADGTLVIKPIVWKEQTASEFTLAAKDGHVPVPAELVKWNDSLVGHWKKTGRPSGVLSSDMLPSHVKLWLDLKCRAKVAAGERPAPATGNGSGKAAHRRNGNIEAVPAK